MDNLSSFFELLRLIVLLVVGGTVFKICISLIKGEKVKINPLNPMNLKARWPKEPNTDSEITNDIDKKQFYANIFFIKSIKN